ncbi:MAG: B12-binding domain-containing radical SAM protein [Thermoplasmata archaeon]|nr:MAG: B12-binding domain-containing radical SAM protein [Thermoplasmata archaeon]
MTVGSDGRARQWRSAFRSGGNGEGPIDGGALIVLTASASEISDYSGYNPFGKPVPNPFIAFTSAFPSSVAPRKVLRRRWLTPDEKPDHTAKFVPLGLRKVESILLQEYSEEQVKVVHPESLHMWVGPETRVLGINTMNPLGLAYVDTTYSSLIGMGGESINSAEFKHTVFHPSVLEHRPTVLVGGGGSWQIDRADLFDELGVTSILTGECENVILPTFRKAIGGEPLPRVIKGGRPEIEDIPPIRSRSTYGLVEIMRGCGRMCKFCSPTLRKRIDFPAEYVVEEVERNVAGGSNMAFAATEDVFLYKHLEDFRPNRKAIVDLFSRIAAVPGVDFVQISHSSLVPAICDERMIEDLTHILLPKTLWRKDIHHNYREDFISVEVGIETGSVRIMEDIMPNKARPFDIKDWPELVVQAVGIMNDHSWFPLATLMTGMPDETEDDTMATLELLDDLKDAKMFFTPLLFFPLEDCLLNRSRLVPLDRLTEAQWEFLSTCWRYNVDFWFPRSPSYRVPLTLGSIMTYLLYYRWKHGNHVARHLWKVAGFPKGFWPESLVRPRVVGGCDLALCVEDEADLSPSTDEEDLMRRNGRFGESA